MDVLHLTQRLIGYDSSTIEGMRDAAAFVMAWLEAHDHDVDEIEFSGRPILACETGSGPTRIVFHGHLDVVPGHPEQFEPTIEGDRLYGRGAYDMKGGLSALLTAFTRLSGFEGARILLLVVSDEESQDLDEHAAEFLVERGYVGDFAITGEPTDMNVGIQAKGALAARLVVDGTAAHGSRPWLGDNAILKAIDAFREIERMPFTRHATDVLGHPSANLGRIGGGDAFNKVPDRCTMDLDIRYLPGQDALDILEQINHLDQVRVEKAFDRHPVVIPEDNPFVTALVEASAKHATRDVAAVGRDGTSDAIAFVGAGMPTVEFGPVGEGHHGPREWVSVESLAHYCDALVDFVRLAPGRS